MYNVKGPSKFVAKTRRGLPQSLDSFKEHQKGGKWSDTENEVTNGPKPVFQNTYKRSNSRNHNNNIQEDQEVTPQHEEIIKFINDSWNFICSELETNSYDSDRSPENGNSTSPIYFEDEPATELENFKPFDLEGWWGKRLYTYITNSVNNK